MQIQSAKIENGVVTNVAMGLANGYIESPDWVGIGFLYDGSTFTAPPPIVLSVDDTLAQRLEDVSAMYRGKLDVGYLWLLAPGGPQILDVIDKNTREALYRAESRAKYAQDDLDVTFNFTRFRFKDGSRVDLNAQQIRDLAKAAWDWERVFDDVAQDHKDALQNIADTINETSTQTEIDTALAAFAAYDINLNW